jgi:hypothetical protein
MEERMEDRNTPEAAKACEEFIVKHGEAAAADAFRLFETLKGIEDSDQRAIILLNVEEISRGEDSWSNVDDILGNAKAGLNDRWPSLALAG